MAVVTYVFLLAALLVDLAAAHKCEKLGGLFERVSRFENRPDKCFCFENLNVLEITCRNANTSQILDAFTRLANLDLDPYESTSIKLKDVKPTAKFPGGMLKKIGKLDSFSIQNCQGGQLDIAADAFRTQDDPSLLTTVRIEFCNLNNPAGGVHPAIKNLPALTKLHIDGKGTEMKLDIKEDTFDGMKLTELSLKNVGLKTLISDAFSSMISSLKTLDLGDVPVENVFKGLLDLPVTELRICAGPSEVFPDFVGTLYLSCAWDNLIEVNPAMFKNMYSTESLIISYVKSVPKEAFKNLKSLKLLRMISLPTGLTNLVPGTFEGIPQLEVLKIANANITKLGKPPIFSGLDNLKTLDFAYSGIQRVENGALDGLKNLEVLDLSGNAITFIQPGLIAGLTKLKELNLYTNKLQTVDANILCSPELDKIELGYNLEMQLTSGSFEGCSKVKTIEMDVLRIPKYPSGVFAPLKSLEDLNICCGRLQELEVDAFAENKNLTKLSLSGNDLETLPKGIFDNNDLIQLHVNDNPWNCTQDLKWLVEYAKTRTDWVVYWNCDGEHAQERGLLDIKRVITG